MVSLSVVNICGAAPPCGWLLTLQITIDGGWTQHILQNQTTNPSTNPLGVTWCVNWLAVKSHIMLKSGRKQKPLSKHNLYKDLSVWVQLLGDKWKEPWKQCELKHLFFLYSNLLIECQINSRVNNYEVVSKTPLGEVTLINSDYDLAN